MAGSANLVSDPDIAFVPILTRFKDVASLNMYAPVPDDWWIGVSDVVNSTRAIELGSYRQVNLAGAGTITAVSNALGGRLQLFAFTGDGARIVVPAQHAPVAEEALSRTALWARRSLNLELRVAMSSVADVRSTGLDVLTAFWQASADVRYAMFAGGGIEWFEDQLKSGRVSVPNAQVNSDPNLTGLSCQWGTVESRHGSIVSLIVKRAEGALDEAFIECVAGILALFEEEKHFNPIPDEGPPVPSPLHSVSAQGLVPWNGIQIGPRWLEAIAKAAMAWLVLKSHLKIGRFDPDRYRREMAANTDYRKFDDGLLMTVDCSNETMERLNATLAKARADGVIRYGMHAQTEALITCMAPSIARSDHVHFVDGAQGGYAFAARMLR